MKITDPKIIKNSETDLIDAIREKLDWEIVKDLNKEKLNLTTLECTDGDIVVHENQVAYKLNFEVKASFSVLFDREGNILGTPPNDRETEPYHPPVNEITESDEPVISDEDLSDFEKELDISEESHDENYSLSPSDLAEDIDTPIENDIRIEDETPNISDNIIDELEIPEDLYIPDGAEISENTELPEEDLLEEIDIADSIEIPENDSFTENTDILDDIDLPEAQALTENEIAAAIEPLGDESDLLEDLDISDLVESDPQAASEDDNLLDNLLTPEDLSVEDLVDVENSESTPDTEQIELPTDEDLGILEEITDNTSNEIGKALSKSQEFWSQDQKSPESPSPPESTGDTLKEAFTKSQSFWTQEKTEPAPTTRKKNDDLNSALLKSQNFWADSNEPPPREDKEETESQIVEIEIPNSENKVKKLNNAFLKSQNFWLQK